ncbi:MAG: PilZ domain-containing protein [Pseudomonadales bacterium]|nr:PilZ domain-containing protein [Pseudomonadales bacterium]
MTTSPENDHRIEHRLRIEETVIIELLDSSLNTQQKVVICSSSDLSANGIQVVVDQHIAVGSILRLCLDLPNAAPIFLTGEVKWTAVEPNNCDIRLGFLIHECDQSDIVGFKYWVADKLAAAPVNSSAKH